MKKKQKEWEYYYTRNWCFIVRASARACDFSCLANREPPLPFSVVAHCKRVQSFYILHYNKYKYVNIPLYYIYEHWTHRKSVLKSFWMDQKHRGAQSRARENRRKDQGEIWIVKNKHERWKRKHIHTSHTRLQTYTTNRPKERWSTSSRLKCSPWSILDVTLSHIRCHTYVLYM